MRQKPGRTGDPPPSAESIEEIRRMVKILPPMRKIIPGPELTALDNVDLILQYCAILKLACDWVTRLGVVSKRLLPTEAAEAITHELARGRLATVRGMAGLLQHTRQPEAVFALIILKSALHALAKEYERRASAFPTGRHVVSGEAAHQAELDQFARELRVTAPRWFRGPLVGARVVGARGLADPVRSTHLSSRPRPGWLCARTEGSFRR
jgi:hypothetical protein